jgi:hypothetical protein
LLMFSCIQDSIPSLAASNSDDYCCSDRVWGN